MFRSFLSWRYLLHRRTNLIGIVGVLLGVGALILILSIMTGFLEQTRASVRGTLADFFVRPAPLLAAPDPEGLGVPPEPDEVLRIVRSIDGVRAATPQYTWYGMLAPGGADTANATEILSRPLDSQQNAIELVGIDVASEFETTGFDDALRLTPTRGFRVADPDAPFARPPGYRPDGLEKPRIVLGDALYGRLRVQRGDELTFLTVVFDPESKTLVGSNKTFIVAGSFRTKDNEVDARRAYVEREVLADFLRNDARYTDVLVMLADYDQDAPRVRDELRAKLLDAKLIDGQPAEIISWEDMRAVLLGAIRNERVLMAIMLSLILVVACFSIFAILSMMVTEKRRDIGVLTALGATPRGVMQLFLMIAFWDALVGAVIGAILGTWMAIKIDPLEQWLSKTFGVQIFDRTIYYFDEIPSVVEPLWVAVIVLGAFACALVFAAIPAWRAARMDPLEALRYE
ncbi:MAG: FtsX-like permease family protein [Planctomycetes bacterium]|nr:FtsX-like permease family protein [Planctomycetota bacterium]